MAKTLAIVVGGGPAPGINGVISAATIEARKHNMRVLGFYEGFRYLARGEGRFMELRIRDVSRIHDKGGSILRTSRENPTGDREKLRNVLSVFRREGVDYLLTIGGDDTAFTSSRIAQESGDELGVVHVPKTIDNDLPLPGGFSTFGFQTARHRGVEVVRTLMEDAWTTSRWYFVVSMGRKAGHLALGIGQAAGATLTVIAEEFEGEVISLDHLVDILEVSILKRLAMGHSHGVAVLAEGIMEKLPREDLERLGEMEQDEFGHLRYAELDLGRLLQREVKRRLERRGIGLKIISKNVGYELRCADPIPFDMEYTRTLGYGALKCLMEGVSRAMVCVVGGKIQAMPFDQMMDSATGRVAVRYVDIHSERYQVAREYMIRLRRKDVEDKEFLEKLAEAARCSSKEFLERFGYLIVD
ncbi:MAG: 6-phosphofructokinase [Planctomycetota bacterium]|nr:MAG: 6-phosphofructokinase [Planctomycetota bacterium]